MSKLALGTVQFGLRYGIANRIGQVNVDEAKAMLVMAQAHGIQTLDTAINYGESESVLGQIGVSPFKVVSKLPAFAGDISSVNQWALAQTSASLARLGISHYASLMLHRPSQLLDAIGADLYRALCQLKDQGVTRKIGISVYSPAELERIIPKFDFDVVQIPFNLFDRRLLTSGCLGKLKDRGIEVHTRSTFLQGLMLMSRQDRPPQFGIWSDLWSKWDDWVAHSGLSPMQACMAYVLGIGEIDKVVIGADNSLQLLEIIESAVPQGGIEIPDLACQDERLINPSNWGTL
jgi:aryl-alcohol dehydrogenase-like predicted oxidoreductase